MMVLALSPLLGSIETKASTMLNVGDYKGDRAQTEWLVPKEDGKVFAGWYQDAEFKKVYRDTTGNAYPKFVDEKVLTVKKQIKSDTTIVADTTNIRFLTAIDSLMYKGVTFKVEVPDSNKSWTKTETTAYTSMLVDGETEPKTADTVFGTTEAVYFVAHSFTEIPNGAFAHGFTVTPSWETMDGTVVTGETVNFTVRNELNLQKDVGTDFEGYSSKTNLFAESGTLSTGWKTDDNERKVLGIQSGYQGVKLFHESEDNIAVKVFGSKEVTRVGFDINDEIKNPGIYKASIKIKAGPEADNITSVLFRFHNKSSLLNANAIKKEGIYFRTSDDTTAISKDGWRTLEVEFMLTETLNVKDDLCIALMVYTNNTSVNKNNYALVDDLEIFKLHDLTNLSSDGVDFEGYSSETHPELFDSSSEISLSADHGLAYASTIIKGTTDLHGLWFADSNGNKAVAMQKGYTDLRLAKESNGNVAVKVSKGNGTLTRVGIDVDDALKEPGTYRAFIRVYAGPEANNVGNILFKLYDSQNIYANGNKTDGFYFRESANANPITKGEWITLTVDFTITKEITYNNDLCAVFVVYNNYQNENSYVLLDDFEVFKLN